MFRILFALFLVGALAACGDNVVNSSSPAPRGNAPAAEGENPPPAMPALALSGNPQKFVRVGRSYSFQPKVENADPGNLRFFGTLAEWMTLDQKTGLLSGKPTMPGKHTVTLVVIDGAGRDATMEFEVEVGVPWTTFGEREVNPRSSSVVLDGKIYFLGGESGGLASSQVQEFNPATGEWISSEVLKNPRYDATAAALNGKIYIFGGLTTRPGPAGEGGQVGIPEIEQLATIEEYDPVKKESILLDVQMTHSRHALSSCVLNGKIYLIGGIERRFVEGTGYEDVTVSKVEIFTKEETVVKWELGTPASPRYEHHSFVENGRIFVVGGRGQVEPYPGMEVYTPAGDNLKEGSWENKGSLKTHAPVFSQAHEGHIYLFGGVGQNGPVNVVWKLDVSAGAWTPMESIPSGPPPLFGAKVGDAFYFFGGGSNAVYKYRPVFDYPEPAPAQ